MSIKNRKNVDTAVVEPQVVESVVTAQAVTPDLSADQLACLLDTPKAPTGDPTNLYAPFERRWQFANPSATDNGNNKKAGFDHQVATRAQYATQQRRKTLLLALYRLAKAKSFPRERITREELKAALTNTDCQHGPYLHVAATICAPPIGNEDEGALAVLGSDYSLGLTDRGRRYVEKYYATDIA